MDIKIIEVLTSGLIGLISAIIGARIGVKGDRKLREREENKKIKISTFILYMDITNKIKSIKDAFKQSGKTDIKRYSISPYTYNYKEIEKYLIDLSHLIEVIDLQVIRTFYTNYSIMIEPINKEIQNKKHGEKYIEIDMEKVKYHCTLDRNNYKALELFYNTTLYKKEEVINYIEKLKNIIMTIEKKENFMKYLIKKIKKEKTFSNYKTIRLDKSIEDLNKEKINYI